MVFMTSVQVPALYFVPSPRYLANCLCNESFQKKSFYCLLSYLSFNTLVVDSKRGREGGSEGGAGQLVLEMHVYY